MADFVDTLGYEYAYTDNYLEFLNTFKGLFVFLISLEMIMHFHFLLFEKWSVQ
jgi:hypothetical protein